MRYFIPLVFQKKSCLNENEVDDSLTAIHREWQHCGTGICAEFPGRGWELEQYCCITVVLHLKQTVARIDDQNSLLRFCYCQCSSREWGVVLCGELRSGLSQQRVQEQGSTDNPPHRHNCASEDAVAEEVSQRTHAHTKQDLQRFLAQPRMVCVDVLNYPDTISIFLLPSKRVSFLLDGLFWNIRHNKYSYYIFYQNLPQSRWRQPILIIPLKKNPKTWILHQVNLLKSWETHCFSPCQNAEVY